MELIEGDLALLPPSSSHSPLLPLLSANLTIPPPPPSSSSSFDSSSPTLLASSAFDTGLSYLSLE